MSIPVGRFLQENAAPESQTPSSQSDAESRSSSSTPRPLSESFSDDDVSELNASTQTPQSSAPSSVTSLHPEPFAAIKIDQPASFMTLTVQAANQPAPTFTQDIALPSVGVVPTQFHLPTLPGNTAHMEVGSPVDASELEPTILAPGESPKAYVTALKNRLFERVTQAPAERLALAFLQPMDLHVALGVPAVSLNGGGDDMGVSGSLLGAVGSAAPTWLTALDQVLETRRVRFWQVERSATAPFQLDGISLEQAEATRAAESGSAAQRLSAALAGQQAHESYWSSSLRWLTRGSHRFMFSQIFTLGAWFLPRASQVLEAQALLAYDKAVRQLRDAKPQAMASGETSSNLLAKLYQFSSHVGAIDQGAIDLPSMVPPLVWFGQQPHNRLKLVASAPLRFEGHFAHGDDDVVLGASSQATLAQSNPWVAPLVVDASVSASANARGVQHDVALLASDDKAHNAMASVSIDAKLGATATMSAETRATLSNMMLEFTQSLSWTPSFAQAFVRSWLPELMPLPATLPGLDGEILRAVGLARLAQAPTDVVARIASSFSRAHVAIRGVPSQAAHALVTHTPIAGHDPALASLWTGLPSLQHAAESIALNLAAHSELDVRVQLRQTEFRLDDSPYAKAVPLSSMMNVEIRSGDYTVRYRPQAASSGAEVPHQASVGARIGAMLAAPLAWVGASIASLARMLVHALKRVSGKANSHRQEISPKGAEIRLKPYVRIPFAKRLFGHGIPLSWLVQIRLFGAGYTQGQGDGVHSTRPAVGAEVQPDGTARLTGQVRLFGIPVFRIERLSLLEFPLGSHMLDSNLAYWSESPRPWVTTSQWMNFGDQLVDGLHMTLQPSHLPTATGQTVVTHRPIALGSSPLLQRGLGVSQPVRPVHLQILRDAATQSWSWALRDVQVGLTQSMDDSFAHHARVQWEGSLEGRWQRAADGEATLASTLKASGDMHVFDSQRAHVLGASPLASGQMQLELGGQRTGPAGQVQWTWTSGSEAHQRLIDALGVSADTAVWLPESVSVKIKGD